MIKRKIIFVIGLLIMPLFWIFFNLASVYTNFKYEGLINLYKEFYMYYKSGESFGAYD